MSVDSPQPQDKPLEPVNPPKSRRMLWLGALGVLFVAGSIFFFNRTKEKIVPETPKKQEPHFHRDEPTVPQIMQSDYQQKVREMLDSGKTVMEISKETRIRIDEVRRIKKEYNKQKSDAGKK